MGGLPCLAAARAGGSSGSVNAERHQLVMRLFQQALDRQGADRGAFLQTACGTDETLREEVESLLSHHDPRTIAPARGTAADGISAAKPAAGSSIARLVPQALRPTDPNRLRTSLIALALALFLAAIGYLIKTDVERVLRKNLANQLQATLESNIAAVTNWLKLQEHEVHEWAQHPDLRKEFQALVQMAQSSEATLDTLRASPAHRAILDLLLPLLDLEDVRAINGTDSTSLMVLTSRDTLHERYRLTPQGTKLIAPVFLGQSILLPPMMGRTLVENEVPGIVDELVILVGSPVRDDQGRIIGGLFASIESGREFTRLLDLGRAGERGENYAFGAKGQLLVGSDSERKPAAPGPLAAIAGAAIADANQIHTNLDGYKNPRGVRVVGASKWLEDYGFGVVSEIEFNEAYAAAKRVGWLFRGLFSLLLLTSAIAFASSLSAVRLRREVGIARQLGQYTLQELIGEGGMGKVYKAKHALLRRPTAVKVLEGERAGAGAIARFEREVQLASSLTHPNTVEIYDYGRTEDGIFYFAMEYLPGLTLDGLVKRHGAVGTARMLYLFQQILGSIAEAHNLGLIHRDIKPGNIILCRRGGEWDFIKVVDFGLARDLGFKLAPKITQTGLISGTPLYIAPECLEDPDNCSRQSDIYVLGVVAFYLLTGRDLYVGNNALELLQKALHEPAPRVADVASTQVPTELDDLIVRCVAKQPADRPASVDEMLTVIKALAVSHPWTQDDARAWWREREPQIKMCTSEMPEPCGNTNSRSLNK
jgi:eukaryotic-like serine/threonine-protein kinase